MRKKIFIILFILNFIANSDINAQSLIVSNLNNQNQSFNFNIGPHAIFIPGQRFFVGSQEAIEGNIFAVSANISSNIFFKPLTPEKVTFNNALDIDNPLYGAAISHITMAGYFPIVIKKNDSKVYAINDGIASNISVFSTDPVYNSQDKITPEIVSIMTDLPQQLEAPESLYSNRNIFIATSKEDQENKSGLSFDGIALAQLRVYKEVNNNRESTYFRFVQLDAQNGTEGNKPVSISKDSEVIKINSALKKISRSVDLHFDNNLNRLYIALKTQAGDNDNDGVKAIVLAGLSGNKIRFQSILPDTALLTSSSKIVASKGANIKLKMHKVRTMFTRTYLNYLIVVGGTGNNSKQKVFALPLVNNTGSEHHGCLANINAKAINVFTSGLPHRFLARTFLEEAKNPEDLYDENDIRAKVGGNQTLPGDITNIQVSGDTVFVSVQADQNNKKSGIFFSQALFEESGKITGWTNWQRAALRPENINGFEFNPITGNFWSIPVNKDNNQINKVFRTEWTQGQTDLEKLISQQFLQEHGGVQNLVDIPFNNQGLDTTVGNRFSFLILTGLNKVGLIQSSKDIDDILTPTLNSIEKVFISTDGTLNDFNKKVSSIFISGGDLECIENINSAAIISDNNFGWLVVGGSKGLAILTKKNGAGWNANQGLSKDFSGLDSEMYFIKIGNYENIRKLIASKNKLYILTDTKIDRVELDAHNISYTIDSGVLNSITLAQSFKNTLDNVEIFSDLIISEPIALLGTSNGFFRSGNNVDISKATSDTLVNWTLIKMPESVGTIYGNGPATRFFPITTTGQATDIFNNGNIYLLNSYSGYEQAQIYRYALSSTNNTVTDSSVLLFQDIFIKGKPTFFVNLEDYRNYIYTDGAVISASRSAFMDENPKLFLLPHGLRSGQRFGARNLVSLNLDLNNFKSIGQLNRISAGAYIVYGDFGIRINQ